MRQRVTSSAKEARRKALKEFKDLIAEGDFDPREKTESSRRVQLHATLIDVLEALASMKVTPQEFFDSLPASNELGGRHLDPVIDEKLPQAFKWLR